MLRRFDRHVSRGNLTPDYSALNQVVVLAVFEGEAEVAIGVTTGVCPNVAT